MFTAYERFWEPQVTLRSNLESRIQQILIAAADPQISVELVQQLQGTQELSKLEAILARFNKPSGFRQPQAHIGALCAEMARNGHVQRSIRRIQGRRLVAFNK